MNSSFTYSIRSLASSLSSHLSLRRTLMLKYIHQGETESRILEFAQESNGTVEACVAKPGLIDGENENQPDPSMNPVPLAIRYVVRMILPRVHVRDMSAALLDQVVHSFEKETLTNADLARIGQKTLALKGSDGPVEQ